MPRENPRLKVQAGFIVDLDLCKAPAGETGLCISTRGHPGRHRFFDCAGAPFRLVDGSTVPFLGNAG